MKYYGLYFISTPTNNAEASTSNVDTLVQGIESSFPVATRHTPWSLQYRVFRDTIPPGTATTDAEGKPKPFAHAYQHLLHVSSLDQSTTYICTRPPGGKAVVTGIPLRQQDAHASLVRNQFAALWQLRHILSVQQGITYNAGLCTIQLGVLRAAREGPQSGVTPSPGVVVCISTNIGSDEGAEEANAIIQNGTTDTQDEPLDFEYAQTIIRDCWSQIKTPLDLGRSEIKEIMMEPEAVKGAQENEAAVQIWAEVLRLRG